MNHWFRASLFTMGYFKTMGAKIKCNSGKRRVVWWLGETYTFVPVLYLVSPLTLSGVPCLHLVWSRNNCHWRLSTEDLHKVLHVTSYGKINSEPIWQRFPNKTVPLDLLCCVMLWVYFGFSIGSNCSPLFQYFCFCPLPLALLFCGFGHWIYISEQGVLSILVFI